MSISKRCFVRIISFGSAIIAVLAVFLAASYTNASVLKRQMEYSYLRSIEDLSVSLDNIKTTLNKGMYAYSPEMMNTLSGKLWSDASTAKVALSQLPVEELNLENTYKFLSQVGNYSKSLAEKYASGTELTSEDKQSIRALYGFAESLSDNMWEVEQQISDGYITFEKAAEIADDTGEGGGSKSVSVTEGFTDFEEGFDNYPTLIYDGPFSDHILEKNPLMLEGQEEIGEKDALERASSISGIQNLEICDEEKGKMPSYVFCSGNTTVAITKAGGQFSYLLNYREVGDKTITAQQASEKALAFLNEVGIDSLTETYYEINNGICIINFAAVQQGVTLYTDLIKVGVAMDNGEIISCDARGYITNHTERSLSKPMLSRDNAITKISPDLTINSQSLCVIPSSGMNERFCYEFSCSDADGKQVLVYVNADTGKEEQILLLQISDNGVLTV